MISTPQNYSIRDGGSMSSITTSQVLVYFLVNEQQWIDASLLYIVMMFTG